MTETRIMKIRRISRGQASHGSTGLEYQLTEEAGVREEAVQSESGLQRKHRKTLPQKKKKKRKRKKQINKETKEETKKENGKNQINYVQSLQI